LQNVLSAFIDNIENDSSMMTLQLYRDVQLLDRYFTAEHNCNATEGHTTC